MPLLDPYLKPVDNLVVSGVHQPSGTTLVGYAALIAGLGIRAPLPATVTTVSEQGIRVDKGSNHAMRDGYAVYQRSYKIEPDVMEHLVFALRYERTDLLALKRIFEHVGPGIVADYVRQGITGKTRRQLWFFYEFLTGTKLDLPDADAGNYVDALDSDVWQVATPVNSTRHRVRDNLPGNRHFCALIDRTAMFDGPLRDLVDRKVRQHVDIGQATLVRRLTRRLLLKDSQSTFLIESESPSGSQKQRWADVVAQAGKEPLGLAMLVERQKILMAERRFVEPGLRIDNVFLGERIDGMASPDWVGARKEDLASLMDGLFGAAERMNGSGVDPISQAAAIGFGFVFIHPFQDGNGRTHRYLMQHVLAANGINPMGMTVPLAKAIWEDMEGYETVLKSFDGPRMPMIDWTPTRNGNVDINNDTGDLYRFFDATEQALYMKSCMEHVLDHDIPDEVREIDRHDRTLKGIRQVVDMPDNLMEKLSMLILQNKGQLSKSRRRKEFVDLTDDEVAAIEDVVREVHEVEPPESPSFAP